MTKSLEKINNLQIVFGKNVRKFRKELSLTQDQLSEITGLHSNYISDVERGIRNVSIVAMEKFSYGLKTEVYKLLMDY